LTSITAVLEHHPNDRGGTPLYYQWWMPVTPTTPQPDNRKDAVYIAGFQDLQAAVRYGQRHGWPIPDWVLAGRDKP